MVQITGNTVFAALGLSGQPRNVHPDAYMKSVTSIGAFCVGTLFFSAYHRLLAGQTLTQHHLVGASFSSAPGAFKPSSSLLPLL